MDAAAQHDASSRFSPFGRAAVVLMTMAVGGLVAMQVGCSTAGGGREEYFASRADTVMFNPGTGETRVSVGPDSPFGNDRALADGSDTAPRGLGEGR